MKQVKQKKEKKKIYNDENIEIGLVEAIYNDCIDIKSIDNKKEIILIFNKNNSDFNSLNIGQTIDLKKYLCSDTTLKINETSYLFYLTKANVFITEIDDNKFNLFVSVTNPDIIYIYNPIENELFKDLKMDIEISFLP